MTFCTKILFCNHYFRAINTFERKGKDPDPDPYWRLKDPDADPGGQKHMDPNPNADPISPFLILHLLHVLLHPGDEPSLLCLVNDALAGAAQVLDEGGEGDPAGGVHVEVLLVPYVLLVDHVGVHSLTRVLPLQDVAVALNIFIIRFGTVSNT